MNKPDWVSVICAIVIVFSLIAQDMGMIQEINELRARIEALEEAKP